MTTEIQTKEADKEKKRMASAISGGIFLISLGVLLYTGWWWPGIMFAIGLSGGAQLIFLGKTARGIGTLVFLCHSNPRLDHSESEIPWTLVGPLVQIGIGVIVMVKAVFLREE